MKIVVLEAK